MRRAAVALLAAACPLGAAPPASASGRGPVGWASLGSGTTGGADGTAWSDTRYDYCKQQRQLKQTGSNKEKAQIQLTVPSNTTLGSHGEHVQRHDELLDIEDGSDLVTVSDSRFTDHDKAILVGSGDGRGDRDRGHLKVAFARNLFTDIVQRGPRVRFGQVHVVNNVYVSRGRTPLYALGVGIESAIHSERDVFRHDASLAVHGGARFHHSGSWTDGRPAHLNAVAAGLGLTGDVGWDPADVYDHRPLTSAAAVEHHVLTHAGTGRRYGRP